MVADAGSEAPTGEAAAIIAPDLLHVAATAVATAGGVRGVVAVAVGAVGAGLAGAHGRVEVDEEGEDVGGEEEGDQPLEDGGGVGVVGPVARDEGDG